MTDTAQTAKQIIELGLQKNIMISVAESCTGGMVSASLTDIPGSSSVFDRGFITYSNEAKAQMLDVSHPSLEKYGAVSSVVAKEMAFGAIIMSRADLTVAITGIAGPGGGTAEKPVGLVWFAIAETGKIPIAHCQEFGDIGRANVRTAATDFALSLLLKTLS